MKFKQKGIPGLGERIKQKIDEDKESVAKIAELTGMSRSVIYNIISTDHATANNLYKLCKVLEVSADYLLFGDEDLDFLKKPEEKPKTKKVVNKRFKPPTLEEVKEYCSERKNNINPERFIDYYESNGWKVGRNKMKDWQATVRNWERWERNVPKWAEETEG